MFAVDKGIPTPEKPAGAPRKYPFAEMAVGDSFFAPKSVSRRIPSAVSWHSKRIGGKFTCRTVTENGVEGVRVWRIA